MNLKRVKSLAERRQYKEALEICNSLLSDHSLDRVDILRTRAYIFALSGNHEKALLDRREITSSGGVSIKDYYLAANDAVEGGQFYLAIQWLQDVLEIGEKTEENWFRSAALFLLAYSHMEVGNFSSAKAALKEATEVDPEVALPLPNVGLLNSEDLNEEITRRQL